MSKGGKSGGSSAKAPDYTALAAQQGTINQQTAQQLTAANRPNQYDAFGNSITWNQVADQGKVSSAQKALDDFMSLKNADVKKKSYWGPSGAAQQSKLEAALKEAQEGGTWEQHQTLNPETKAAWDTYNSNAAKASSQYGDLLNNYLANYQSTPFSSGAQNLKSYNDAEFNGDNVAQALYGSVMDRAAPQQQRDSAALDAQLKQQGLIPGTESYNNSMQNLMKAQGDVNSLAAQNATLAGANEGRQRYSSYLAGQGQQYGQDMNSYQTNQNMPLQQLSGMAGIASGTPYTPTYTGFSSATGYNPTDLLGAAQAQQSASQSSTNSSNAKKGSTLGAGASMFGSFMGGK